MNSIIKNALSLGLAITLLPTTIVASFLNRIDAKASKPSKSIEMSANDLRFLSNFVSVAQADTKTDILEDTKSFVMASLNFDEQLANLSVKNIWDFCDGTLAKENELFTLNIISMLISKGMTSDFDVFELSKYFEGKNENAFLVLREMEDFIENLKQNKTQENKDKLMERMAYIPVIAESMPDKNVGILLALYYIAAGQKFLKLNDSFENFDWIYYTLNGKNGTLIDYHYRSGEGRDATFEAETPDLDGTGLKLIYKLSEIEELVLNGLGNNNGMMGSLQNSIIILTGNFEKGCVKVK
jgi:hypothetical protein